MPGPRLSVVVPFYDEAEGLEASLVRLASALGALVPDGRWEILAVDDGSRDASVAIAERRAAAEPRIRVLRLPAHRGKGAAVRAGVLASGGEHVAFTDADLSVDLAALDPLLAALEGGADFVLGSRRVPGARIERRQPRWREGLGHAFSLLAGALVAPDVRDFTCGLKGWRAAAARAVFERASIDGWAFDVELVAAARGLGLATVQLPVTWRDRPASKVRVARAAAGSLGALAAILGKRARGAYARRPG